jgi:putative Ca2+/H+ antiporter (TMEM165/GDT1 family)
MQSAARSPRSPLTHMQGFTAAFGLIFVSEIGDKTFFIAALLSMRRGKAVVLAGAVSALALMTAISVGLGRLFSRLPDSLSSSLPLGEYCAAALLLFFGAKALKDALALPRETAVDAAKREEEEEAKAVVNEADAKAKNGVLAGFLQSFALIFVAEWGDRSMLATIALGAAQNPVGVFFGAVGGHAGATLLAVMGGALLSKRISERAVGLTSGVLFLVFAVATAAGLC